jgi:hypothetical protein
MSSTFLGLVWTCESHARDILTVYYSAAATGPSLESAQSDIPDLDRTSLQMPTSRAWVCNFSGTDELRRDAALTFGTMLESSGEAWLASGPSSVSGLSYVNKPSYYHMATKGAALIVGFELSLMVVMTFLPREVTKWEDDFVSDAAANLSRHIVSAPIWDEDDWRLNYLGHPYLLGIHRRRCCRTSQYTGSDCHTSGRIHSGRAFAPCHAGHEKERHICI